MWYIRRGGGAVFEARTSRTVRFFGDKPSFFVFFPLVCMVRTVVSSFLRLFTLFHFVGHWDDF